MSVTYPDAEVVEGVLIDVLQLVSQAQCVVGHSCHVTKALQIARRRRQPCHHDIVLDNSHQQKVLLGGRYFDYLTRMQNL